MQIFKPDRLNSRRVIAFMWIGVVCNLVVLVLKVSTIRPLDGMVPSDFLFPIPVRLLSSALFSICSIISIPVFLAWFLQAYRNVQARAGHRLRHRPGWALFAWFVPFINLFRPYGMMREMLGATATLLEERDPTRRFKYRKTLLGWWWGLSVIPVAAATYIFLAAFIYPYALAIGNVFIDLLLNIPAVAAKGDTYAFLILRMIFAVLIHVWWIAVALLTIKLVGDYSRAETLLAELPEAENPLYTMIRDGEGGERN